VPVAGRSHQAIIGRALYRHGRTATCCGRELQLAVTTWCMPAERQESKFSRRGWFDRRPHRLILAGQSFLTGYGRGRDRPRMCSRSGPSCGSSGGKRRPGPHGHGSLRPSFSTSSVTVATTRSPRLTLDSLEGTPGGACWSAQKDASASRSRYMAVLVVRQQARGS
jgi:hypothetical protein